jgi:hypothetical protein
MNDEPFDASYPILLGRMLYRAGRLREAEVVLQQAVGCRGVPARRRCYF